MGKEIKIGLGVLSALLVVFVVVLVVRLTSSREEEPPLAKAEEPFVIASDLAPEPPKPAPSAKPSPTRVSAEKPQISWTKAPEPRPQSPSKGKKRYAGSTAENPAVKSSSSTFVLDPPPALTAASDPAGQTTASPSPTPPPAPLSYPSERTHSPRYDNQPAYQNVSAERVAPSPNNYGDYRSDYRNEHRSDYRNENRRDYGDSLHNAGQYNSERYHSVSRPQQPPASPLPPTGPRGDGSYEVQPNDSYWQISQKIYGNGGYFRALAEYNRNGHPVSDRLRVGEVISTPALNELIDKYADLCPSPERQKTMEKRSAVMGVSSSYGGSGGSYTVQAGDTLYDIARYELGDAARWVEILELNRRTLQGDFDYLSPGMKLVMPRDNSDRMTRRPEHYQTAPQETLLR